jgi:hypothetical protein
LNPFLGIYRTNEFILIAPSFSTSYLIELERSLYREMSVNGAGITIITRSDS